MTSGTLATRQATSGTTGDIRYAGDRTSSIKYAGDKTADVSYVGDRTGDISYAGDKTDDIISAGDKTRPNVTCETDAICATGSGGGYRAAPLTRDEHLSGEGARDADADVDDAVGGEDDEVGQEALGERGVRQRPRLQHALADLRVAASARAGRRSLGLTGGGGNKRRGRGQ